MAEETSARAALTLLRMGVGNVRPLRGGYAAWLQAGHPVERGAGTQ